MNLFHKELQIPKLLHAALWSAILFSTTIVTNRAAAESTSQGNDPLLHAMQQELDREKALMLPGMQRPYFIEYRLDDINT